MVKIKDVATAAGVSTATVSRVLSGKPHVRPAVRAKVMAVVGELGYRPNRVARNLRSRRSNIIALIVADIENPFFQQVSRAVEDTANAAGFSVILCNNDEDERKESRYLELVHDENLAGVILSPTRGAAEYVNSTAALGVPIVVIDRRVRHAAVDSVFIDNERAAYDLVGHLIEHGYRRIAAIFGAGTTTGKERRAGCLRALREQGLRPMKEVVIAAAPTEEDGYACTRKLLSRSLPLDALVTSNSLLAAGALLAMREADVNIPADMAFASFYDTTWARLLEPPLTVIQQPTHEIGRTAARMLVDRIAQPERPHREITLHAKLIIRQSCGCRKSCR